MSRLRILGVTGGIGSGKSTVCVYLREMGGTIFEADQVARELMESNLQVREAVIKTFGSMSYLPDGALNRPWLADQVFRDEVRLSTLNSIVHPRVLEVYEAQKQSIKTGLLVHEAALIYEAGLEDRMDAVCVVSAPEDMRIMRVRARDGIQSDTVRVRMERQMRQEEKEVRADVVLVNADTKDELRSKTRKLYELTMDREVLSPDNFRSFRRL